MATGPVIGTDGFVPIYDPEGLWKIWALQELWMGPDGPGQGKHVGKVNDYVREPLEYNTWIIDHVDPVTLAPTLRVIKPKGLVFDLSSEDVLFGVGPGTDADTYRAYLNDTVFPHTMEIDKMLTIKGTMSKYCKVFLGADTSAAGEVISKIYDASGNYISDVVPLEMVEEDSHTNYAVKIVPRFHVTRQFPNAEKITAVFYADDGHVVSKRQLLIENTDIIQDVQQGKRYIQDIAVRSIWLSPTEADVFKYPLNIPMDAMNMTGVVIYSDGEVEYPIDGGKFRMDGLLGRLSGIEGQRVELSLVYNMSPGEYAYASTGENGRKVTKPYFIVTTNPNNSISVKLFGFPVWESPEFGYRVKWYLLNAERNVWFDATPHVRFSPDTGLYDPKLYGYKQTKRVEVNLHDVSPTFMPFRHVQVVDIALINEPTTIGQTPWTVNTESSPQQPRYGSNTYATIEDGRLRLKATFTSREQWLEAFYRALNPIIVPDKEIAAPNPTHFIVNYEGVETEWPIAAWDQDLNVAPTLLNNKTITIRFIKRMAAGDLQLAIGAVMILRRS